MRWPGRHKSSPIEPSDDAVSELTIFFVSMTKKRYLTSYAMMSATNGLVRLTELPCILI